MELHLSGISITKLHTTIAEGPQVGPRLTKMNANMEPFLVVSFITKKPIQNIGQLKNPLNVKLLELTKIITREQYRRLILT